METSTMSNDNFVTADVAMMDLRPFDVIDFENYTEGGGSGKSFGPPPEGRYTGRVAQILDDGTDVISSTNNFGRTQEGYLKVDLPLIEVLDQSANGYTIKYSRLSSKKYTARNGSQVLDFLRACGIDARPKNEAELRAAVKSAAGRPFQFQLVWEAYNKNSETTLSGEENFPLKSDGTRQSWIKDEFDDQKRWFANGKVRYYVSAIARQQ